MSFRVCNSVEILDCAMDLLKIIWRVGVDFQHEIEVARHIIARRDIGSGVDKLDE